jgi:hypothetical protein
LLNTDLKLSLRIFNPLGEEVSTSVKRDQSAGNYNYKATDITGVKYSHKIEAVDISENKFVDIKKMMLLNKHKLKCCLKSTHSIVPFFIQAVDLLIMIISPISFQFNIQTL